MVKNLKSILKGFNSYHLKQSSKRKFLFLIGIGVGLKVFSHIPLPGLDYSLLSPGKFSRVGLLELGILPFIQASILSQFLIPKNDNEDDFNKEKKTRRQIKLLSGAIALVSSFFKVKTFAPAMYSYTFLNIACLMLTLTTGALLLVWLSEWISEVLSLSGSTIVLLFTGLIDDFYRLFYKVKEAPNPLFGVFIIIIYFILVLFFTLCSPKKLEHFSIRSSRQAYSKQIQSNNLSFTSNPGAISALVLSESLIKILSGFILFNKASFLSLIAISFLRLIFIVFFSYHCSKLQVNNEKVAKDLNTANVTILTKEPTESIKEHLDRKLKKVYLIHGIYLALFVGLSEILGIFYPLINLRENLSSFMIFIGAFYDLEDRLLGFFYAMYNRIEDKEN